MKRYWIIAAALVAVSMLMHLSGILRFDTTLPWSAWVVAGLVLLNGGWIAFDGGRAFLLGAPSARWAIVILAVLGLWYIPFGTLINIIVITLLFLPPLRSVGERT